MMYGNPGDYVWGRGGFDAIVTQLLNQMEGSGPPPMTKDIIEKDVPIVKVSQKHVDEKLQCSVCWDDFKLDETVRRLNCEHIFHPDCIVPWLELHATCPVCRKPLTEEAKAAQDRADREYEGNGDNEGPAVVAGHPTAAAGAANTSTTSRSSHTPSSSNGGVGSSSSGAAQQRPSGGGGSSHQATGGSEQHHHQPMDVTESLTDAISMVINQLMGPSQSGAANPAPASSSSRSSAPAAASSSASSSATSAGHSSSTSTNSTQQQPNRQNDFQDFEPE